MVTPELLSYIKAEVAKGKTREQVSQKLLQSGGWSDMDISEAFREIIPMPFNIATGKINSQTIELQPLELKAKEKPAEIKSVPKIEIPPPPIPLIPKVSPVISPIISPITPEPLISSLFPQPTKRSHLLEDLIFVLVGFVCIFSWYFYTPQIIGYWNRAVESSQELSLNTWNTLSSDLKGLSLPHISLPSFSFKMPSVSLPSIKLPSFSFGKTSNTDSAQNVPTTNKNIEVKTVATGTKNCGTTVAPKFDSLSSYDNNPVLACLGESATNCGNATATLTDDFFPTIFQITNDGGVCQFKLSYAGDSKLVDITGKKLSGQSVSCPIDIVRAIDNTNGAVPRFVLPEKTDLSKYASQIYFYGTLGLFTENNLDKSKIQALGCEGDYIASVIASYSAKSK